MCVLNGETQIYSESMLVCARVTLIEQRLKNTRPQFNGYDAPSWHTVRCSDLSPIVCVT